MYEGRRLVAIGIGRLGLGFWDSEQLAGSCDGFGTGAAGEQAVVADAMESLRQHVNEEPPDELAGGERRDLVPRGAIDPIVFVLECDAVSVGCDQPAVGDGDTVG